MIEKNYFGKLSDGTEVYNYTMKNANGVTVKVCEYGAVLMQVIVPDKNGNMENVIGGYDNLQYYVEATGYQGAVVGRFGNRIALGKFTLDGKEYTLATNNGNNHLHGGPLGYSRRVWNAVVNDCDEPSVAFERLSPDGEEGYPGNLNIRVTYTLTKDNAVSIRYEATTDKKTILNVTNHSYFNLGGFKDGSNIYNHYLKMDADSYIRTHADLIPTGEIVSVDGTPFDFREGKLIGKDINADYADMKIAGGYDHCLNFTGGETKEPVLRATLKDMDSGRAMKMYTNQPGVQMYSANNLKNDGYPLVGNVVKVRQMGLCLETEHMPDSINHDNFTDVTLDVGEKYDYTTIYAFSAE